VGARPSDALEDRLVILDEDCPAADADGAERSILPRSNVAVGCKDLFPFAKFTPAQVKEILVLTTTRNVDSLVRNPED
jgi:hypothetical protein